MRLTKKSIVVSAGAAAIALSAIGGAVATHAAAGTSNSKTSLIDAIAQKFNLKANDVQQVFDQQRAVEHAAHEQKAKTALDQAVKDGKLTQAQEDAVIAKQAEVKAFMATLSGKSETDRRTAMKTEIAQVKDWAAKNAIPSQYMHGGGMGGHFGHGNMAHDMETNDDTVPTSSPTAQ
jgi:hypothetical protein